MALEIKKMGYADIEKRIAEMPKDPKSLSLEQLEQNTQELIALEERRAEIKKGVETRKALLDRLSNASDDDPEITILASTNDIKTRGNLNNMEQEKRNLETQTDLELRSLQKFITNRKGLTETEERSLDTTGSAVFIPKHSVNQLITSEKYSDLLHRATVFQEPHLGTTVVPVSGVTKAKWKNELEEIEQTRDNITGIELFGYELMSLLSMSVSAERLSQAEFKDLLLNLLATEVITTLEDSFISGTGTNMPKGLRSLDYVADENMVETAELTAEDLATALSLLPQKYNRNAIIIGSTKSLLKINQFVTKNDGTMGVGTDTFLNRPVVSNENLNDDELYIVDPAENYVKFSQGIEVEADRSSGFRSATIDLRALCVVDSAWNPSAVVKVSVTA